LPTNRREFMLGTTAAAATQTKKPNIILYLADQFRWDFVGANRLNNSTNTPNLDAMAARAIRTPDWVYCVADPEANTKTDKAGAKYHEYLFYDERGDPNELINLAARKEFRKQADILRDELKKLIVAAGEPEPEIVPAKLYTYHA
jgi:arylsulfatase A-like enzyme